MKRDIRIVIADDKKEYRKIFRDMLRRKPVTIVGEASNGRELIGLLRNVEADIVLLDINMPVLDGCAVLTHLEKANFKVKVIMLSVYDEEILVSSFMDRGARAYLSKTDVCTGKVSLYNTIERVFEGDVLTPALSHSSKVYSRRQKQIVAKMLNNKTSAQIAEELSLSLRSIEKHRTKIYELAGARSPLDFYKYAFSNGLQFLKDAVVSTYRKAKKK